MGAVTFCLLLCVPRYQLAQTLVSPHGAAGQQKQPPPLLLSLRVWSISCIGKILIYFVPGRPVNSPPYHPSSGCHVATHFMLAHKAVPHGCRHLSFTTMCSTIPTSPAMTPVSPHGAAGQQKQPPSSQTRPERGCDTICFRVDYGSRTYFPTDCLQSS